MTAKPSVLNSLPSEFGGIYARQGFAYQDDVAAKFYIEMLSNEDLISVSCETHDDILLIRKKNSNVIAEFVQVKDLHLDQLWTISKLCQRESKKEGTSILEKSLGRDGWVETSWFRLVTSRQLHSELIVLAQERGHEHRNNLHEPFKKLSDQVERRVGSFKSSNENRVDYWLANTLWEVMGENDIARLNQNILAGILYQLSLPHDPDTVRMVYEGLLTTAKETAEFGIERWKEKTISRNQLLMKLDDWIDPYPNRDKTERLEKKLTDAGLDSVCRDVARDQQRFYLKRKLSDPYLTLDHAEEIEYQVLDLLHHLRSSLDSDSIQDTNVEFHDRCLTAVRGIEGIGGRDKITLPHSYLSGCMYEITARCRHRFRRLQP